MFCRIMLHAGRYDLRAGFEDGLTLQRPKYAMRQNVRSELLREVVELSNGPRFIRKKSNSKMKLGFLP